MEKWIKEFIATGAHKMLLQIILRAAILVCGIAFVRTEKSSWGIMCLFYMIWHTANALKESIESRRENHLHNWNFVDYEGLPIVITRGSEPKIHCPTCDSKIAEVK